MTVRGYQLAMDFAGTGTFEGPYDDVTGYILAEPHVQVSWGRDANQSTAHTAAGKLTAELDNDSRIFSPENTSSPISSQITPGLPVRWSWTDPDGKIYTWRGVLDDFDADPTAPAKTFSFTALDGWGWPGADKLSTPLYQGLRTGDAIGLVLDAIGWTGPRDLDPGATFVSYWWAEGDDAGDAIEKLLDSEGPPALAYVSGGTFVFRDRHHRILRSASTTSAGTYTHRIPATGFGSDFKMLTGSISYDHGLKNIFNAVDFDVSVRAPRDTDDGRVWSSDEIYTLTANQVLPLTVSTSDPFLGAVTPVAGTDFTVLSGGVSVSLSRTSGAAVTITLTDAGTGSTVQGMALRATPVPVVRTVKVSASVPAKVTQHWDRDVPWCNPYDAQAIANRIVAVHATNRPRMTFTVAGIDEAHLRQIMARALSDRVTVRDDQIGINADMIVEQITHETTGLGVLHEVTFGCEVPEPTQATNAFTFNVAGKGFDQGQFAVDYIDAAGTVFLFDTAGHGFNQGVLAN